MDDDIIKPNNPRNGKAMAGIILLIVGTFLLIRQFDFFFIPGWLFSFPTGLIVLGLFIGAKSNFHKPSSFLLILFGAILLIDHNLNNSGRLVWPMGIIAFGLWIILRRRGSNYDKAQQFEKQKWDWKNDTDTKPEDPAADYKEQTVPPNNPSSFTPPYSSYRSTGDDYLDAVSVFGAVKKKILSKDFKGGEIVNVFGGAELDFTQADINGRVIIDVTQIFGSIKLIVPSNWQVVPDIAAVLAGIEDKRMKSTAAPGSENILILKGVSIFAGVDIRSY